MKHFLLAPMLLLLMLLQQGCSTPSNTPESSALPWTRPAHWEGVPPGFGALQSSDSVGRH